MLVPDLEYLFLSNYFWNLSRDPIPINNYTVDIFSLESFQTLHSALNKSVKTAWWCSKQYFGIGYIWYGSVFADPYLWLTDPDPNPAIFVSESNRKDRKWPELYFWYSESHIVRYFGYGYHWVRRQGYVVYQVPVPLWLVLKDCNWIYFLQREEGAGAKAGAEEARPQAENKIGREWSAHWSQLREEA
jgi:hypothetical protein